MLFGTFCLVMFPLKVRAPITFHLLTLLTCRQRITSLHFVLDVDEDTIIIVVVVCVVLLLIILIVALALRYRRNQSGFNPETGVEAIGAGGSGGKKSYVNEGAVDY